MSYMFQGIASSSIKSSNVVLDLSGWNTSKVINMSRMFEKAGFYSETFNIHGLEHWNTSNVTNMSYMFSYAGVNATT